MTHNQYILTVID